MSFIEFDNVVKRYVVGEQEILAADGVTFSVERGEFCVIVGSSGAGKTVIVITHNTVLTDMADRVIRVKSGKILSSEINPAPLPVEQIEW